MTVKIYTTPTCVFCKATKDFFKQNSIQYEEVDVSKDQKAVEEMVQKSGQLGVPVIDINGKVVIGFDKARLKEYLGLK